jgi:hypothetical protein
VYTNIRMQAVQEHLPQNLYVLEDGSIIQCF